nr:MAG TPA: hypothetical protein [Caudoviricetes sp.]
MACRLTFPSASASVVAQPMVAMAVSKINSVVFITSPDKSSCPTCDSSCAGAGHCSYFSGACPSRETGLGIFFEMCHDR